MTALEVNPTIDPVEALPIDGQGNQLELNLGLPDSSRRLINAIGVTARVMAGERVEPDSVSARTHGAETVALVRRALRGNMTEF